VRWVKMQKAQGITKRVHRVTDALRSDVPKQQRVYKRTFLRLK